MKKFIATLIIVNTFLWFGLSSFMSSAKANDYNEAVIGHIITETLIIPAQSRPYGVQ